MLLKEDRLCNLYSRASGHTRVHAVISDGSGTNIARGELVMKDANNNQVIAWTTSSKIAGIAVEPSTAASTRILVDFFANAEAMWADADSDPAANLFSMIDGDRNSVDPTVSTNDDFLAIESGDTDRLFVYPNDILIGTNGT